MLCGFKDIQVDKQKCKHRQADLLITIPHNPPEAITTMHTPTITICLNGSFLEQTR